MKTKKHEFQFDESDRAIISELLRNKLDEVRKEAFYFPKHTQEFYQIYFQRYEKLLNWFTGKPRPILKEWKL